MRIRSVLLAVAVGACARTPVRVLETPRPDGDPIDSATAVAVFDSVWSRINVTYYDTTFRGVDWRSERARWRPVAARARVLPEARGAIDSLLSRLADSHLGLIPREQEDATVETVADPAADGASGYLGIELRWIDAQAVVVRVARGSAAARAGVQTGWVVRRVGSLTADVVARRYATDSSLVARRNAALAIPMRLAAASFGAAGSRVDVEFVDAAGAVRRLDLTREPWPGEVVRFGAFPPQHFVLEFERLATRTGCAGILRFTSWMPPLLNQFEPALDSVRQCRGVVLDLRGNPGGIAAIVMGLSGFFVDRADSLGELRTRTSVMRYIVNPRRVNRRGEATQPYAGALAILIDPLSASTTEIFAAGMRDLGRARLFGDTTAGKALPATFAKLQTGDLLMYPIADFRAPRGQRLEATGVAPDVYLPAARADLIGGIDAPLRAAVEWIATSAGNAPVRGTPGR